MGSIPVYGAQDMGISPEAGYSVEGTELSQTEEALSGENVPQETADTSNEENVEENQKENTEVETQFSHSQFELNTADNQKDV